MRSFFLLLVSAFLLFTNASAKRVWVSCFFAGNSGLEYKDTNVSSSIHIDGSDGELYFYNNSGKTIYIDLTNSHVFLNGQTQCLASLSTTVKINDSYKKLNSIERMRANIIAINSDSWQNTLFVFSIDDNLRKDVITKGKYSCGFAQLDFGRKGKFIDPQTKKGVKFQVGMTRHYDENTTPLDMRAIISYSTDPNFWFFTGMA